MDKIWDRDPSKSEVIGHCSGNEKTEWPPRTDKVKNKTKKTLRYLRRNKYVQTTHHL